MTDPPPWFTAHERSLRVGLRVRVRLNGECEFPHEPEEDGATGVIDARITQEELDIDNATAPTPADVITVGEIHQHVWSVTFDDPERVPYRFGFGTRRWEDSSLYAAGELIPLSDTPPR